MSRCGLVIVLIICIIYLIKVNNTSGFLPEYHNNALYNGLIYLHKYWLYIFNSHVYSVIDQIPEQPFDSSCVPLELRNHILCINIPNIKEIYKRSNKAHLVLDIFCTKFPKINALRSKFRIFDVLGFSGAYFPIIHTDIEWNKIRNPGFQVWSLVENNEYEGNMFILYNPYLWNKYKDISIVLRIVNNEVIVIRNGRISVIGNWINKSCILERIPVNEFIHNTKKFYLAFKPGDTILFKKNVLHMSDYRTAYSTRKAFNFRVAISNGLIDITEEYDGFVGDLDLIQF